MLKYVQLVLNWKLVRALGQLQILNRASLTLLVFVPVLAAFWPAVRSGVNRYNSAVLQARADLESTKKGIDGSIQSIKSLRKQSIEPISDELLANAYDSLQEISTAFQAKLDDYITAFEPRVTSVPKLPRSWAIAFFASLLILAGRTLFQLFCPEKIRDWSVSQFVDRRRDEYSRAPSDSSIDAAIELLGHSNLKTKELVAREIASQRERQEEIARLKVQIATIDSEMLPYLQGEVPMISASGENADDIHRENRNRRRDLQEQFRMVVESDRGDRGPDFRRRMAIIEHGAIVAYDLESKRHLLPLVVCATAYSVGAFLLLQIVYEQSCNVASAAGWI